MSDLPPTFRDLRGHREGSRPRHRLGRGRRPTLDQLERRTLLAGQKVAYVVSGLGGDVYPDQVVNDLVGKGFTVHTPYWNSTDPAADNPVPDPNNPGQVIPGTYTDANPGSVTSSLGTSSFPANLNLTVDLGAPNTPDQFVTAVVQDLETHYDGGDTVVLIGHSLGGSSALQVATQLAADAQAGRTQVHVALLATLDPVGYLKASENPSIVGQLNNGTYLNPDLNTSLQGAVTISTTFVDGNMGFNGGSTHGPINDDGLVPGFRTDASTPGLEAALPAVPAGVTYFYNRWQTNAPFPLNFKVSGQLAGGGSVPLNTVFPNIAEQSVANTTTASHPTDPLDVAFGSATIADYLFQAPSNSLLHATFPDDPTIQGNLDAIINGLVANNYTVTTNADEDANGSPVAGSLRAAIVAADASGQPSTIDFASGSGLVDIVLAASLPAITVPVTIDGTSQPGYQSSTSPVVVVDGFDRSNIGDGIVLDAGNSTVKGVTFIRFTNGYGLRVGGTGGDLIQGNDFGFFNAQVEASQGGLILDGAGGNSVSGNVVGYSTGIGVSVVDSNGNTFQSNMIGVNSSGTASQANSTGLSLLDSAANTIGGSSPSAANVISGNTGDGVEIQGASSTGNVLTGNLIGTDAGGSQALGNGIGVHILDASSNTIGLPDTFSSSGAIDALHGNVISGNNSSGVEVDGADSTGNVISGDGIGVNEAATAALPNQGSGILIVSASRTVIGGTAIGAGNVISGNNSEGIKISGPSATGNVLLGNAIGTNLSGEAALGNRDNGIFIDGAPGNIIGQPGAGNVISGNKFHGISIGSATSIGNVIRSNLIGVDRMGFFALGNAIDGIFVGAGQGTVVGGTDLFNPDGSIKVLVGNLISANKGNGVEINSASTSGNLLQGNLIGTSIDGTEALANASDGVFIYASSANTIGGGTRGAGNLVSGNKLAGVRIDSSLAGNLLMNNVIGLDSTGSRSLGNTLPGVLIQDSSNNVIGSPGAGNVVSGNLSNGIEIDNADSLGNLIQGNLVGTDASGEGTLGNTFQGILTLGASRTTIGGTTPGSGNLVSGNNQNGVAIGNGSDDLIEGNFIGTDLTGTRQNLGNALEGIDLSESYGETIGGSAAGARNVISGNNGTGITLIDRDMTLLNSNPAGDLIAGNYIGVDATGAAKLSNFKDGLFIDNVPNVTVGGNTAGARNIISGNLADGLILVDPFAINGRVIGNYVGTDATGSADLGNGQDGILVVRASQDAIGGTGPGEGNLISANKNAGIAVSGVAGFGESSVSQGGGTTSPVGTADDAATVQLVTIQGNLIGTDATGTRALGNLNQGVLLFRAARDLVGGPVPGAGNLISANGSSGVAIQDQFSTGNLVEGNEIGTNVAGTGGLGNKADGVFVFAGASADTIGGTAFGASNLISGNNGNGIDVEGNQLDPTQAAHGIAILGNILGADARGVTPLPNFANGIFLNDAPINAIGGLVPGASNLISGNRLNGILISGGGASGNYVVGNDIGVDRAGAVPPGGAATSLGNGQDGVFIADAPGNVIGLADAVNPGGSIAGLLGNVISGNSGSGVQILGGGSTGDVLQGNLIGTDRSGVVAIGNLQGGVVINDASFNTIGGLAAGTRNVIAGNLAAGVQLLASSPTSPTTVGNAVVGDFIGLGAMGFALGNAGDGVLVRNASGANIAVDVISANAGSGVEIIQGAGNQLVANRIGTDPTGTIGEGNKGNGVLLNASSSNGIGGFAPGSGNVLSGNSGDGVAILAGSSGDGVVGNQIGTDPTGSTGLGNGVDGVFVQDAGVSNAILFDVVSANGAAGIEVAGTSAATSIQGDVIGLNLAGTAALGNSYGVYLNDAVGTTVGGTTPGSGNLISGNVVGIVATSNGTSLVGNTIEGNLIGTDGRDDGLPFGTPQQYGIFLNAAPFNTIGGTASGARNVISGNSTTGVLIFNQIGSNGSPSLLAADPNLDLGDVVQGNTIGTTASGARLLNKGVAAQGVGVTIDSSAGNVVGGLTPPAANLIAGNGVGVEIAGVVSQLVAKSAHGNAVALNTIALNTFGIFINGGQYNTIDGNGINLNSKLGLAIIGTPAQGNSAAGNTISGNGSAASGAILSPISVGDGVYIESATGNTIQGNTIGQNGLPQDPKSGVLADGVGVYVYNNARGNVVANNTIQANTAYGIFVYNSASNLGTIYRTGSSKNAIGGSGIADFREYTGPVTTASVGSTPKGPKAKKKK